MKNLIVILLSLIFFISNIFAYLPTIKDDLLIQSLNQKVDKIYNQNPNKINNLVNNIEIVMEKYRNNQRIYYILSNLLSYIQSKSVNQSGENSNHINDFQNNKTILNCESALSELVKNHNKHSVTVSDYNEMKAALNQAKNRNNDTQWFEIVLKKGVYNMGNGLWLDTPRLIIRGETGDKKDVVLKGNGMSGGVTHIFWVASSDIILGDMIIGEVKNHAIQIHGELDADNVLIHNIKVVDTGEQMIKGSFDKNKPNLGSDNGVIECSEFEYTAGIGPQWYIGGIDIHNGKNWIVKNNLFKNIISPESSLAEHAIHFWSNSEGTIVKGNVIVNCDRGIGFGLGNSGHIGGVIQNNIIYHNQGKGDVGIGLENAFGAKILDNIIYQQHSYPNAIEYRFEGTNDLLIKNNLTNKQIKKRDGGNATLQENNTNLTITEFKNYFPDYEIYN